MSRNRRRIRSLVRGYVPPGGHLFHWTDSSVPAHDTSQGETWCPAHSPCLHQHVSDARHSQRALGAWALVGIYWSSAHEGDLRLAVWSCISDHMDSEFQLPWRRNTGGQGCWGYALLEGPCEWAPAGDTGRTNLPSCTLRQVLLHGKARGWATGDDALVDICAADERGYVSDLPHDALVTVSSNPLFR